MPNVAVVAEKLGQAVGYGDEQRQQTVAILKAVVGLGGLQREGVCHTSSHGNRKNVDLLPFTPSLPLPPAVG